MFVKYIWPGFKLLLSLSLLAALPWVDFELPDRALGLSGIVFGLGAGFAAWQTAFDLTAWPSACRSRSGVNCELPNLPWLAGGPTLAALPLIVVAVALFWEGARLVRRTNYR